MPVFTPDSRSAANIATLVPSVQKAAAKLLEALLAAGIQAKIISGTRTYQEQDALYAQGRTAKGPKVTNARAGYSWHNFGIALDIGIFHGIYYLDDSPLYAKAGAIGQKLGWEWGGAWKAIKDEPHFQWNPKRLTLTAARELHAAGKQMA